MTEEVLYDNTGEPVTSTTIYSMKNNNVVGFTFHTGAQGGTLADLKLGIVDGTPNDGGDIKLTLGEYDGFGKFFIKNSVQIGLLSDTMFSYSTTATDIPLSQQIVLNPNTTYVIEATGVGNSAAALTTGYRDAGTGVVGNDNIIETSGGSGGTSANFEDGAIVARVTVNPVCFVTGTRIRTTRGDCAVEDLAVGDIAVTASGETRPIVWIGHRVTDCSSRHELHPVRVAAHAFSADLPVRDLWLSPGHPVLVGADEDNVGGHLVPIMCLVNGTTIARVPVDAVTYWHVELDAHDILLAEDLPAESYLDWGDRAFFKEGSDHALANPDFVVPGLARRCRPVAIDGQVVEAERARLDAVFASRLYSAAQWPSQHDLLLTF